MTRWGDVGETFRRHFNHYAEHGGGENALMGLRAEESVVLQYAGRVVYELFQNALDQARNQRVIVRFDGRILIIGNDGAGVSVDPSYDYSFPVEGKKRSDFHALCSLHTSNKIPDTQFGNKGIGFRSIFGVADRVQVWSRCEEGGWWGLELCRHLVPSDWPGSDLRELDEVVRSLGDQARPSFQFPRPLRKTIDPVEECSDYTTVVRIEVNNAEHQNQIAHEVERLSSTRFQFVGLRRPGLAFLLNSVSTSSEEGWKLVSTPKHHRGFPELAELARLAQHVVKAPCVAVAWPEETVSQETRLAGLFYNYLPTRLSTGLPIDVHGDFQLKDDREGMALDAESDVGRFNLSLFRQAAKAHVEALRAEAFKDSTRPDLWQLADLPTESVPAWAEALRIELFPNDEFDVWLELASHYFRSTSEERSCREFWEASLRWIEQLVGRRYTTKRWEARAKLLCDALAIRRIPVIPVVALGGQRAVAVPSRQERGQRAENRVFYSARSSEVQMPPVPETLLRMGRVVTAFPMGSFEIPAGIQPFSEVEILPELRQVPNDPSMQESEQSLSPKEQGSLLRFAFHLKKTRSSSHFAWRAFADSENQERVGRALATMYLPTKDGLWEPSRQLTEDRVNLDRLSEVMGVTDDLRPFLCTLGVAPAGSVPLVEGGIEGILTASLEPPILQVPGNRPILPIAPILDGGASIAAVMAAVNDLPPDNDRSLVFKTLRNVCWMSRELFRNFEGLSPLPRYVAPAEVILHCHDPQRIFFAVPVSEQDHEALRQLGAAQSPDDEALATRVSLVLRGLKTRLPSLASLPMSIALSLSALFNRLMRILPLDGTDTIPVIIERVGHYDWLAPGDKAWLARSEDRQKLRRFFPDIPIVAAEYREGLAGRLQLEQVRIRAEVQPSDAMTVESDRARQVREGIEPHLAVLAAAADQSRQCARTLSDERFRLAWYQQAPIVEVSDAWVKLRVEGPDREAIQWRKGEYDDVFHLPGPNEEHPGVVLFDVAPQKRNSSEFPVPLRFFGDALAALLVGNSALGPLFAQVLSSIEDDRIQDFVERSCLKDLVKEWTARLHPLSDGERKELLSALANICVEPARVLQRGCIALNDLLKDATFRNGADIEALLRKDLRSELVRYLPKVMITTDNEAAWRQWYEPRQERLLALMTAVEGRPKNWQQDMLFRAREYFDRVDFVPSKFVAALLREWGAPEIDLEDALSDILPHFLPVTTAPLLTTAAGLIAGRGDSGMGQGGPHRKLTTEDLYDDILARSIIGNAAEHALLPWVVNEVARLQRREGFRDALLSAFNTSSKTRREVVRALDAGNLRDALYVADHWSGAGFDILGLEEYGESLMPIRYECKYLSATATKSKVHLSRNELAVARRVHRDGPGRWVLVGVQPDGTSVDLTPLIVDLLVDDERLLKPLYQLGLEPDGLRLEVKRNVDLAATDGVARK